MSQVGHLLGDSSVLKEARRNAIERIRSDPGLPSAQSTTKSFWITHAKKRVPHDASARLPAKTDVLVIGSGVSGVSVCHHLLDTSATPVNGHEKPKFTVTLLEARDFCSGATGRNGGHIYPYGDDYADLKSALGEDEAKKIVSFRFEHVNTIVSLAKDLGIAEDTQARELESANVYLDSDVFDAAVEGLSEFKADKVKESSGYVVYNRDEARAKFGVPDAAGVITHPAGAVWPYKLSTALVSRLLEQYSDRFHLFTNAPASEVTIDSITDPEYPHQVTTSKGMIRAKHVVHCTEGHQSHLLPNFRGVILPFRGQMSAQKPGKNFTHQGNDRSWIIHYEEGYDYLTQLPISESISDGEMMFGGGLLVTTRYGLNEIGTSKDDCLNMRIKAHLNGALRAVFGEENYGGVPDGTVKAMWTGIMGFSADGFPWVGKLPSSITNHHVGAEQVNNAGEWITSGYSGEGMVLAFLCGKAVAQMIQSELRRDATHESGDSLDVPEWLPKTFLVSEKRFDEARVSSEQLYVNMSQG